MALVPLSEIASKFYEIKPRFKARLDDSEDVLVTAVLTRTAVIMRKMGEALPELVRISRLQVEPRDLQTKLNQKAWQGEVGRQNARKTRQKE